MSFEKIITQAEDTREEVAELCSKLVQINSSHPEGRTDQCVAYIKEYLYRHGIENEIHSNDPPKPNLVAKIKGTTDRKILWVGHMDVVTWARTPCRDSRSRARAFSLSSPRATRIRFLSSAASWRAKASQCLLRRQ